MQRAVPWFMILAALSCSAAEPHYFMPIPSGAIRRGVLRYEHGGTVVSGDVGLHAGYSGDFFLLFTDAAGRTLVELQQDQSHARIRGQLVGGAWQGTLSSAPPTVRAWLSIAPLFINQVIPLRVRKKTANETFTFDFGPSPHSHLGF